MLAGEEMNKPSETKVAVLWNLIGDEGVEVYTTFKFEKDDDKFEFTKVMDKFEDHWSVKPWPQSVSLTHKKKVLLAIK